MRTLYGLRQSPWTERARWSLDHHGVVYRYHEHVPMLGELLLRRKARTKKASVPLLADGKTAVMGSFEIAKHAEGMGRGAPLFPRGMDADIERWNEVAERMTRVGRAWLMKSFIASSEAQREALPPFVPGALRRVLAPTSSMAVRFLAQKHAVAKDADYEVEHTLRPALEDVRAALGDRPYLLGVFTYADVATRAAWTNEALARQFEDLLLWRDALYRKHR